MPKNTPRTSQRNAKRGGAHPDQHFAEAMPPARPIKAVEFAPKNEQQRKYAAAQRQGGVTFGLGPAGTGKTYVAGCMAAEALQAKKIERIILTRPAVEAGGEKLGYLPGEKEQKFDPYFDPFREVLEERLGKAFVEYLIKEGRIKCEPFAYMRGKTFKNAFVILDEAQNASTEQFKLFLTRIGEDATVVINGDATQADVRNSGLLETCSRLLHISGVKVIQFRKEHIVRSGLVAEVVAAFEAPHDRINPILQ